MGRSQHPHHGAGPNVGADTPEPAAPAVPPEPAGGPGPDDSGCSILHVDMDAFFASVEVRRRPELRGMPVVVGGVGPRGVVSSASYEARAYGIRSAMPTTHARRMCPHAIFLPPDLAAYAAASDAVMEIFASFTPLVEPLSVDEAFLDVSGAVRLFGRPAEIARQIRARVREEQQLTCSVGVAATKFLAKLASSMAKPDGLLVVRPEAALGFLHPLPVEALWGVGEQTAQVLRRLGLRTFAEISAADVAMLRHALGAAMADHLHRLAWADDPRPVTAQRVEKSVSAETTFDADVADPQLVRRTLLALSNRVASRLRRAGMVGRTVAVKVRMADFRTLSRARTAPIPTDVAREIFEIAWALVAALQPGNRIRLVGVRVAGLGPAGDVPRQLTLGEREHGWREAERAADAAWDRFGRGAVTPASLLRRAGSGSATTDISTGPGEADPVSD